MSYVRCAAACLVGLTVVMNGSLTFAQYLTLYENDEGIPVMAAYSGNSDWLVAQRDSRSHLHELTSLEFLLLLDHRITAPEIRYVSKLRHLVSLTIGRAPECVDIDPQALEQLGDNSSLIEICLCKSGLCTSDLRFLTRIRKLKHVTIELEDLCDVNASPRLGDDSGKVLSEIPELEDLSIRGVGTFSDSFIVALSGVPHLKSLEISSRNFTDRALHSLATNRHLVELDIWSEHFTDAGVEALCKRHTLEVLRIHSPLLTTRSARAIAGLPRLKALKLALTHIDQTTFRILSGQKSLEVLELPNVPITDAELRFFAQHASMKRFAIDGQLLSENAIDVFRSMKMLEDVTLGPSSQARALQRRVDSLLKKNTSTDRNSGRLDGDKSKNRLSDGAKDGERHGRLP